MSTTISIGARYRRPGEKKPVYRVARMVEFKHHLPHVVLVSETEGRRIITIGAGRSPAVDAGGIGEVLSRRIERFAVLSRPSGDPLRDSITLVW